MPEMVVVDRPANREREILHYPQTEEEMQPLTEEVPSGSRGPQRGAEEPCCSKSLPEFVVPLPPIEEEDDVADQVELQQLARGSRGADQEQVQWGADKPCCSRLA